ncbi:hypothetical protein EFM54_12110 [Lentilactobacillus buchneri]|uniref:hypothetical protein n=1 Tax=Lentilactobacillus buchneri TaxID=1581 RepID=UPI0021A6EF2B|nr:hypothetical protein [Lentilactobacillus buchneri]MCT2899705.1 hypothetical protein [Lentilactobacillus buchneri]
MIRTYRKITTIQAEQFDGSNNMIKKYHIKDSINIYGKPAKDLPLRYYLLTKEGYMQIVKGSWIATGVAGEHWVIQDSIFKKTYVEVEK